MRAADRMLQSADYTHPGGPLQGRSSRRVILRIVLPPHARRPLNDTSPDAVEVQLRILRSMPAWRKAQLVEDANHTARLLALAGISQRYPDASETERTRLLLDLVLGESLATEVYGPRRSAGSR
jgi:hypothetical protein